MKIKRKRRLFGKNKFVLSRRIRRKTKVMTKMEQCGKIIEEKCCEICGGKQQDQVMILCDQCDDAYHWTCLGVQLSPQLAQIWLCPNCIKINHKPNIQIEKPQVCFQCSKKIQQIPKLVYKCSGQNRQLDIFERKFIQCECCKMHFHFLCFSIRQNSINCWNCEIKIRKQGPKSHEQHINFLRKELEVVHQKGYFQLQAKEQLSNKKQKRAHLMDLKLFQQLTNWQLITRYEASLYYALKSRNLTFCDEQIYTSEQMMALNDIKKQVIQIYSLHQQDEDTYQFFKAKIRKGAVGPYEIREDRMKGFYLVSLGHIEKGTIICQYAGEVSSHRASLSQNNDSIFTLLISGRSKEDLNIIPKSFGNMSRFICGVNNNDKEHLRKVNVSSVRFAYKNRVRIIFVAKKNIEKGDIFYLNYNAGTYEEYPTSEFV